MIAHITVEGVGSITVLATLGFFWACCWAFITARHFALYAKEVSKFSRIEEIHGTVDTQPCSKGPGEWL